MSRYNIALYHLALLAGSKLAMTATIKMATAQIGLDADLQPIKWNVLLHVAPVMKDFTVPQCKDYNESIKHGFWLLLYHTQVLWHAL